MFDVFDEFDEFDESMSKRRILEMGGSEFERNRDGSQ